VFGEPPPDAGPAVETRAYAVTQDGISVIDLLSGSQPQVVASYPLPSAPAPSSGADGSAAADASAGSDGAGADDASVADEASAADASVVDASVDASVADASVADGAASVDGGALDASGDAAADTAVSSTPTPSPATGAPDVSITPDGTVALVRQDGLASIGVISLADGTTTSVPLPSAPTDLTLSPQGDFAVAVLRDTSSVVVLPIPAIVADPTSFTTMTVPGETIGRAIVTADAAHVLLFTTAAPIPRMTVLTLGASPSARTIVLHAPLLAVFPTADSQNAIVLHQVTPSNGVEGAFSIVPIASSLPANIVSMPAPPTAVALAPTGDRALVAMSDTGLGKYGAYLAKMPSLQAVPYPLASPPLAAGVVTGASAGFIAQDYSEGRITFVDLQADGGAGGARTITGFELGARVIEGSNP
jgi:hypothetical protein